MKRNDLVYTPVADTLYYKDLYIEKQDRWNILRRFDGRTEAFVLSMNAVNDSLGLYLNEGGIGDDPDIIDSATAVTGMYQLQGKYLKIKGLQQKDTLELIYERQDRIRPKKWFW